MAGEMHNRKTISGRKSGGAAEDAKNKAKEMVSGLKRERKCGFIVTKQDTGLFKVFREKRTMIEMAGEQKNYHFSGMSSEATCKGLMGKKSFEPFWKVYHWEQSCNSCCR